VDYIIDGGACQVGIESTVLSLVVDSEPLLLRPGAVSRRELETIIGPVRTTEKPGSGAHPSPGMHPRHYSPRTPLLVAENGKVPPQGHGAYLQHQHPPGREDVTVRQMPISAPDYAAALYRELHAADAGCYNWIAVDLPPQLPEWEAVHDRLRRAASKG
jgi:L-threonylcarbamoyladenylate synthase